MRKHILIAVAALFLSTSAQANVTRGLTLPEASAVDGQPTATDVAPALPTPQGQIQQLVAPTQTIEGAQVQQPAPAQLQPGQPQQTQLTPEQQAAQQQAVREQQMQQQIQQMQQQIQQMQQQQVQQQQAQQQQVQQQQIQQQQMMAQKMRQQKMMQQKMMQEQMARNMTPEQKLGYEVHEVKTKIKMKLIDVLLH